MSLYNFGFVAEFIYLFSSLKTGLEQERLASGFCPETNVFGRTFAVCLFLGVTSLTPTEMKYVSTDSAGKSIHIDLIIKSLWHQSGNYRSLQGEELKQQIEMIEVVGENIRRRKKQRIV